MLNTAKGHLLLLLAVALATAASAFACSGVRVTETPGVTATVIVTPAASPASSPTPTATAVPTTTATLSLTPTPTPAPVPASPVPTPNIPPTPRVEVVATGLVVPWALAFAPDGRLFITERPGRIRIYNDGRLLSEPFATLDVAASGESGLMGIALDPSFDTNHFVYVAHSYFDQSRNIKNRVVRLTDAGGKGQDLTVLVDGISGAGIHDGARLKFGPDGKLYVTMGDASRSSLSQDLSSLNGKVLRMNSDGTPPADNPFAGSLVYTWGHRNPQGLAFHPVSGKAFITEHGPNDNDEINILEAGGNYGWPTHGGVVKRPGFVDPILTFTPTIAPAGATFYTGDKLPSEWENNLFFTTLKAAHIHRVVLAPDGLAVARHERLFEGQFGRLRDIVQGPDGFLYFTTSNRDGRGSPTAEDDRIMRIVGT